MSESVAIKRFMCTGVLIAATLVLCGKGSYSASRASEPEVDPPPTPLDVQTIEDLAGADFCGVYVAGKKVGWAKVELAAGGEGLWRSSVEAQIRIRAIVEIEMSFQEHYDFDAQPPFALRQARSFETDGEDQQEVVIRRQGDGSFEAAIRTGGEAVQKKKLDAINYHLADELSEALWIRGGAEVGDVHRSKTFDFDRLALEPSVSKLLATRKQLVEGVQVKVHELEFRMPRDGMTGRLQVDDGGRLLLATVGGVLELRVEPERVAKDLDIAVDLFELGSTSVDRPLGNGQSIHRVVLEVSGKVLPDLKTAAGQEVEQKNGRLIVTLGRDAGKPLRPSPKEIRESLTDTVGYPSDQPKMLALAKEAVGNAKTDSEKVQRLVSFVAEFIDDSYSAEPLTIWKLIDEREGDCSEHALLFTVLARASGLPAREASGLVYAGDEELAFVPHAWNEVVIDGRWVPVDPAWDEFPASPARIRLEATLEESIANLGSALGGLTIKVQELERIEHQDPPQ